MKKFLRRTLRQWGFDMPFRHMVCPAQLKTIRVDAEWRATISIQSTYVFLDLPQNGDLRDIYPLTLVEAEGAIHHSPDSREISRRSYGTGTAVYWRPRQGLVRYAAYDHQCGWSSPGWDSQASLYTEMACEMRTGIQTLEIVAPLRFETAVAFKQPRWRSFKNERSLVKYALTQLDSNSEQRPVIRDNGQRVELRIVGPKVGERFVCIAFTAEGLEEWKRRLKDTSLAGRLKGFFGGFLGSRRREEAQVNRLFT
jgi:hypothetical protein